jgi:sulfur relay (sulfurtransferase) complex TusBCD TusD component (DsrE family)
MDNNTADNCVLFVRSAPESETVLKAQRLLARWQDAGAGAILVFFHGPAVAAAGQAHAPAWAALSRDFEVELWVCEAAWRRRFDQPMASSFTASSLIQFWHRVSACDQLICLGAGHE